jgi:high affinity Mn2+ porin
MRHHLSMLALLLPLAAAAGETPSASPWRIGVDADAIRQYHGSFPSRYETPASAGGNSFVSGSERGYSLVLGVNLGYRLSNDTEFWFREESIRGIAMSNAGGLAGLTDNDMQRLMENRFVQYRALAFVRSKWDLGGKVASIDADDLQFAQSATSRRFTLTAGNVDLLDLFDDNRLAHKGADRFLNWCFMTHCAYDFAADARGYTWGVGGDLAWDDWSLRGGRFAMPQLPNQLELDWHLGQHYGDNLELERRWDGGSLKLLAYRNKMPLSTYAGAFNIAPMDLGYTGPNARVNRVKRGLGVNLDQSLSADLGVFARMMDSRSNGETMAFTEADRSLSAGLVALGEAWHRPHDNAGLGTAIQFASTDRQHYLAQGLYGVFTGDGPPPDGRFNYASERVVEAYYLLGFSKDDSITIDWQHIANPAYNADRGPVDVYGLRLHLAY